MDLIKAKRMAEELIAEHCPDYTFKFDRAKVRAGCCNYKKKTISLSQYFTYLNDEDRVRNIILHEIAHGLTKGESHNRVWRAKAISLGCDGCRAYDSDKIEIVKGKYVYQCPACNKKQYYHRKLKRSYGCTDCCIKFNHGKFSFDYKLIFLGVLK